MGADWQQQRELEEQEQAEARGVSRADLEDPHNEWGTWPADAVLDLDAMASAESEWWREQDHDITAEELADIEARAEIEEYRHMGYM